MTLWLHFNLTKSSNFIGILASPIGSNYSKQDKIISKEIDPTFPWKISLCHTMNLIDNVTVDYTKDWLLNYFSTYNKLLIYK